MKAYGTIVRIAAIAAVVWFASMAISRLLPSYGELTRTARADGARADSLEREIEAQRVANQLLRDSVARADAAHELAKRQTDAGDRRLAEQLRRANAALASESLTLEEAKEQLAALVRDAENQRRLFAIERAAAAEVIRPLRAIAVHVELTYTTAAELASARRDQVAALEARQVWWRRALEVSCEATSGAGGAALGAVVAGPAGAAVGAAGGVVLGALACP